jgi:hypothetical protein
MERKVVDCDRCGAPDSVLSSGEFHVAVHRGLDGAGSNSTDFERADLCPDCQAAELREFLKELGYPEGKGWVKRVKSLSANMARSPSAGLRGWRGLNRPQ